MTENTVKKLALGSCVLALVIVVLGMVMPIGPLLGSPEAGVRGRGEGRLLGHILFAVVGMVMGGIALRGARRFRRRDIAFQAAAGLGACGMLTVIRVMTLINA